MDLDPAYWLNLAGQAVVMVSIGVLIGGPIGFVTWRLTHSRAVSISVGVGATFIGLIVVGFLYLTLVLCPHSQLTLRESVVPPSYDFRCEGLAYLRLARGPADTGSRSLR